MDPPSSKSDAASSILTSVPFPDATSMTNRRKRPCGLGLVQRIRLAYQEPPDAVALGLRPDLPHISGSHGNEHGIAGPLRRYGQNLLPVGRQARGAVAFAQAQGRRAVRPTEVERMAVVKKNRAAVARKIREETVVRCGSFTLASGRGGETAHTEIGVPARGPADGRRKRCRRGATAPDPERPLGSPPKGSRPEAEDCCPEPASPA